MGGYKEHKIFDILKRKNVIIRNIIFIVFIFIVIAMLLIDITKESGSTQNIVCTENSNLDYKVYLKKNDFFEESYLGKDNQYIANLIDYIEANFKYELDASESDVDYKYTYKVLAEVTVEDKSSHKTLYEFSDELIKEKQYNFNTSSKLRINEKIKVDYNKYNEIIKSFVNTYDLENSTSTLTVNMYVNVIDEKNKENTRKNTPAISLSIPLTMETIAINIQSNEIVKNDINVSKETNTKGNLFIVLLLIAVEIVLVVKLIIFIKDTKDEKSVYNMRLRKIMSNYGSYIQKLNNEFDFRDYQVLEIKSFEDLLQVRETISMPIFMTEKEVAMETYFFIQREDNVYVYELKAGFLRRNRLRSRKSIEEELDL